jgi:hypothetical protein
MLFVLKKAYHSHIGGVRFWLKRAKPCENEAKYLSLRSEIREIQSETKAKRTEKIEAK